MNILIDIGHPAHVHLYRNFVKEMENRGHQFRVTAKNVPAQKKLLELYKIPFTEIGEKSDSLFGKAVNQLKYNWILQKLVRKNEIAVGMGTSITVAHVSKMTRMKSVVFDDDDDAVQPLFVCFGHPFSDYLLTPDAIKGQRRKKNTIFYPGYHELAYLHPKRFSPDPTVLAELGLKQGDPYFVLRFNAFKAHHDVGAQGLSRESKRQLIELLAQKGKVFITSEKDIDPEFNEYQLRISPEKVHSLLFYAALLVGDSQTMTSEAAVLGTPALKCNTFAGRLSVPNELEKKYQLCFSFQPSEFDKLLRKMAELLSWPDLKQMWQQRRLTMLQDKIDVTAFMIWFVENLPDSGRILQEMPEFDSRFK
jgi:predicted glycosyltransferase